MEEVILPEKADILISEPMGAFNFLRNMIFSVPKLLDFEREIALKARKSLTIT